MKVYGIAWEYDGGGGFDWYYRDVAIHDEIETSKELEADNYQVRTFEHNIEVESFITNYIDETITEIFNNGNIIRS